MKEKEFKKVISDTLSNINDTIIKKGIEYRRENNPFHNFEKGESKTGRTREQVLDGFLLKHEISISDLTDDLAKGKLPSIQTVNEKFDDNIIYLLIKKAMFIDKIKNETREN
jgi:hypothetical protein